MFFWSILLVNSNVDVKVVSAKKKKQQSKTLLRQLSEKNTDFMIGQSNHYVQNENRDSMTYRGTFLDSTKKLTQVNYSQVDMHTLVENIVSKVRSEVDSVMTTVETRVQDAVLTAIAKLVISKNWPWNQPMPLRDGVLTIMHWNQIRGIFRVIL